MIINYGVTMDGLANQLLNVVVGHERPDLERQWADLVSEMGENATLLVGLEDTLLRELTSSQVRVCVSSLLFPTPFSLLFSRLSLPPSLHPSLLYYTTLYSVCWGQYYSIL